MQPQRIAVTTFLQRAVRGEFGDDPDAIEEAFLDATEAWHDDLTTKLSFHDYLGITETQYKLYVENRIHAADIVRAARAHHEG
jgi:hypothetical protein